MQRTVKRNKAPTRKKISVLLQKTNNTNVEEEDLELNNNSNDSVDEADILIEQEQHQSSSLSPHQSILETIIGDDEKDDDYYVAMFSTPSNPAINNVNVSSPCVTSSSVVSVEKNNQTLPVEKTKANDAVASPKSNERKRLSCSTVSKSVVKKSAVDENSTTNVVTKIRHSEKNTKSEKRVQRTVIAKRDTEDNKSAKTIHTDSDNTDLSKNSSSDDEASEEDLNESSDNTEDYSETESSETKKSKQKSTAFKQAVNAFVQDAVCNDTANQWKIQKVSEMNASEKSETTAQPFLPQIVAIIDPKQQKKEDTILSILRQAGFEVFDYLGLYKQASFYIDSVTPTNTTDGAENALAHELEAMFHTNALYVRFFHWSQQFPKNAKLAIIGTTKRSESSIQKLLRLGAVLLTLDFPHAIHQLPSSFQWKCVVTDHVWKTSYERNVYERRTANLGNLTAMNCSISNVRPRSGWSKLKTNVVMILLGFKMDSSMVDAFIKCGCVIYNAKYIYYSAASHLLAHTTAKWTQTKVTQNHCDVDNNNDNKGIENNDDSDEDDQETRMYLKSQELKKNLFAKEVQNVVHKILSAKFTIQKFESWWEYTNKKNSGFTQVMVCGLDEYQDQMTIEHLQEQGAYVLALNNSLKVCNLHIDYSFESYDLLRIVKNLIMRPNRQFSLVNKANAPKRKELDNNHVSSPPKHCPLPSKQQFLKPSLITENIGQTNCRYLRPYNYSHTNAPFYSYPSLQPSAQSLPGRRIIKRVNSNLQIFTE